MENYILEKLIEYGGATAIIGGIAYIVYLLVVKRKTNGSNGLNVSILEELKAMNSNHLHSLEEAIRDGNERMIDAINNGNLKIIELLGEIKGRLK